VLASLGVDCVTLANNHVLDFGPQALLDTLEHLGSAGIQWVGAGSDLTQARRPALLERRGFQLAVVAATDDSAALPARADAPGVAFLDLETPDTAWLIEALDTARSAADAVLLSPQRGNLECARGVPWARRRRRCPAAGARSAASATPAPERSESRRGHERARPRSFQRRAAKGHSRAPPSATT
jgi:poly-gamma-glutamate synthesis protein (capsule biosynthesis protein)